MIRAMASFASKNYPILCPLDKREENAKKIIGLIEKDMGNSRILYNRLLNYSVKFVKNHHNGEDIVSQFFLHLIETGALTYKYNVDGSIDRNLTSWLYKGIGNLSISFIRNKKRLDLSYFSEKENEDYSFVDMNWCKQKQEDFPDKKTIKKETNEIVSRNIPHLEKKYKDILSQKYFEHASYKKISETQHIPIGTVKSRLHSAKKKFARLEEIALLAN